MGCLALESLLFGGAAQTPTRRQKLHRSFNFSGIRIFPVIFWGKLTYSCPKCHLYVSSRTKNVELPRFVRLASLHGVQRLFPLEQAKNTVRPPDARRGGMQGDQVNEPDHVSYRGQPAYTVARPAKAATKQIRTRRTGRRLPLVPVPTLDWPSNLFADDATMGELVAEDFDFPPHIAAALSGQPDVSHTNH